MPRPSSSKSRSAKPTYLDLLSHEALQNILRYMSAHPRKKNWCAYINPEDARNLYCGEGPLTELACATLTSVNTDKSLTHAVSLPSQENTRILADVLAATGKTLIEIRIVRPSNYAWVDSFVSNCLSLKKLTLFDVQSDGVVEQLLKTTRGSLVSLGIIGAYTKYAEMHCVGLRELDIFAPLKNLSALWRATGSTIECLVFSGIWDGDMHDFRDLQTNCRSIKHLDLWVSSTMLSSYADLCVSYGSQLEFADLGKMPPVLCRKVTSACRNVRCIVQDSLLDQLDLGRNLKELHCFLWNEVALPRDIGPAAESCVNVESIVIEDFDQNDVDVLPLLSALSAVCRPMLQDLRIMLKRQAVSDVLLSAARLTDALRTFDYCGVLPKKGIFRNIATANPCLEVVVLFISDFNDLLGHRDFESNVMDIVESFSVCPALRELVVEQVERNPNDDWHEIPQFINSVATRCFQLLGRRRTIPHLDLFGWYPLK